MDRIRTDPHLIANKTRYQLDELAELLDTDPEQVRTWLAEEDVHTPAADEPEGFGADVLEMLRLRSERGGR